MSVRILIGDCRDRLKELPDASVNCCVTSPPYFGLRDYGHEGQMGLEPTPDEFVAGMVDVFRDVRRVLRDDGTLWLNIGDTYAAGTSANNAPQTKGSKTDAEQWANRRFKAEGGLKAKDLIGIPWLLAFALRADGWYLRQDIIWAKPNPMPESVRDRCTKTHEYLFLLTKSHRYYFDGDAIAEPVAPSSIARWAQDIDAQAGSNRAHGGSEKPMKAVGRKNTPGQGLNAGGVKGESTFGFGETRNKRSVWDVATQPFSEAHFATYPPALIEPCILAGCPKGGTVLDPFGGAGTTGLVADRLQRNAILVELNPEYAGIAERRIANEGGMFTDIKVAA